MKNVTIVSISDTHTKQNNIKLPKLDTNYTNVLVHAGDFSHDKSSFFEFLIWYGSKEEYDYRILIAGNHDVIAERMGYKKMYELCKECGIIYLQDTSVTIEGVKFYGSPYSNFFCNWAFMEYEHKLKKIWANIPDDTNVLITHGPSYGVLDEVYQGIMEPNAGSTTLRDRTLELKELKYHFVGHIHEGGMKIYKDEGFTTYNSSIVDERYKMIDKTPVKFKIKGDK